MIPVLIAISVILLMPFLGFWWSRAHQPTGFVSKTGSAMTMQHLAMIALSLVWKALSLPDDDSGMGPALEVTQGLPIYLPTSRGMVPASGAFLARVDGRRVLILEAQEDHAEVDPTIQSI